jgi:Zn finger protein HypA/HybF involved in hydrogenase expression
MKCIDCGAKITAKTSKKNVGKCNKCYKIDTRIVKDMKNIILWR